MKIRQVPKQNFLPGFLIAASITTAAFMVNPPRLYSQAATAPIPLVATGEFRRLKTPDPGKIEGALNPADFAQEAWGKSFSVSASGLPEGTYNIEIDEAEIYHTAAGRRVMRITSGDTVLADNFDIFVAAGGSNKATTVRGKVEHAADAIGGPLMIHFEGLTENAKFNAIRILNAQGQIVAAVRAGDLVDTVDVSASKIPQVTAPVIYTDPDMPMDARIDDLISRMSLYEKVNQLMNDAPGISRLNLPAYNYWNEALHGVARAGNATVFPQAIGMAAAWDEGLVQDIGDAISTEARAKYYQAQREGKGGIYQGLTFWSPNINIFRDPRWGRGHETYGEDPYLTARTGVAFIRGMQGNDPKYLKTVACAKHFAVHSGPEVGRGGFNVDPAPRDLYETYLPQFQAAVQEGHVGSVMAAYNAIDGVPAAANHWLLTDLLRGQWHFQGHVVSDCGGVGNISGAHHFATSGIDGSAKAITAGLDLECGGTFRSLTKSVAQGLVTEKEIDRALHRVLSARFQLGLFDPPQRVPFSNIPMTEVESPAHLALARRAIRESIVLLKNDGILPLDKTKIRKIAVIGFNAKEKLYGNYHGEATNSISILQGIQSRAGDGVTVEWRRGGPLAEKPNAAPGEKLPGFLQQNPNELEQAVELAKSADVVIYAGGLHEHLEGEESSIELPGFSRGDRTAIELPEAQSRVLKALHATGKPVIFVNCTGSAVAMPWEAAHLSAIVQAWYPGGEAGTGVAEVLFGDYNPAGRLPITFYEKTADLPAFDDYSMAKRTYRYFSGKVLYPFGYGLSYTSFSYGEPKAAASTVKAAGSLKLRVPVRNSGARDGDEVVQVYARAVNPPVPEAIRTLVGYKRVAVARGATANVEFEIPAERLRYWDTGRKAYVVAPGRYEMEIGASSADIRRRVVVGVTG